jgi:acetyl-CoA acyltransferase
MVLRVGLEAIALAADRGVRSGAATTVLAGGTEIDESRADGRPQGRAESHLVSTYPDVYLTTGLVAENHARERAISRDAQDEFALTSHARALAAVAAGRFDAEIVPVDVTVVEANGHGRPATRTVQFNRDEGPRADTSAAALAKLRPAFHATGTVTAGVVADERRRRGGGRCPRRARTHSVSPARAPARYATAGIEPERFGLARPGRQKLLARLNLRLDDIDLIEFNEVRRAGPRVPVDLLIDRARLNVNGGGSPSVTRSAAPARADDDVARWAPRRKAGDGDDVHRRRHGAAAIFQRY